METSLLLINQNKGEKMTLEDFRETLAVAAMITLVFEFVNGLYWAKMVDEHRLPNGLGWHFLAIGCSLTPLVIWFLLFNALYTTAQP
jgi:hypothetical protein